MPKIFFEKICIWIITLCTASVFFIPFVVTPSTYYPYIFPKIIVFRIIVEIGLMAWIPLLLLDKKYRPNIRHPLIFALSLFMGIMVLTMMTGVDPYRSFWSTQERMTGVLTMLHFYVWFLMMISVFREYKEWRMCLFLNIIVSLIIAFYGFVQKGGDGRAFSYLGNALYLGAYAMIQIFFILFVVSKNYQDKKKRTFLHMLLAGALLINAYAFFLAGSRTLFASLIIGSVVLSVPFVLFLLSRKKFLPIILGVVVVLSGITLFIYVNLSPAANVWMKQTIPSSVHRLFLFESYTNLGSRPEIWRIGIEGFKERPILGWGWENFSYVFNKNYQRPTAGDGEKYFDRSHNQLVDVLSLTGMIGLVSYLFLWGVLFFLLFRKILREHEIWGKMTYASIFALFLAYFLQNLTVFDSPVSLILLYFALGLAYFILQDGPISKISSEEKKKKTHPAFHVPDGVYGAGIFGVIAVGILMYQGSILPLSKSMQAIQGIAILTGRDATPEAMAYFKDSLNTSSFTNAEIRMELARDLLSAKKAIPKEEIKDAVNFAISELKKAVEEQPLNVRNYFFLIELYRLAGEYGADPLFLQYAEDAAQKALLLAPRREELYRSMPQVYVVKGDFQKAESWALKGLDYNVSPQEVHLFIANIMLQAKDFDRAFSELAEAEQYGFRITDRSNFPVYLAMNLPSGQENKKAVEYVDRLVRETHEDFLALGAQAIVYHKIGRREDGARILGRIQSADQGLAQQIRQYMQ